MTLKDAIGKLADVGIESAKSDVLTLYSHVTGRSTASLLFSLDEDITKDAGYGDFCDMLKRRTAREPLQYILVKWSFYGDEYKVSAACLIPRPETEDIVSLALNTMPSGARVADLCCGSGCIGIAILRHSDSTVTAVDISADALAIAKDNAYALGVADRIEFILGDVTAPSTLPHKYDVIVSNPPYIRRDVIPTLDPELAYEPVIALDGGVDGLDFYRAIIENYKDSLTSDGAFIFEIGYDQAEDLTATAEQNGFSADIRPDIEQRPRAAILRRRK